MYVVIIAKEDLDEYADTLANVGHGHIPELKLRHDESSKDKKNILWKPLAQEDKPVLWIITHGNEFLAVWEKGKEVVREAIYEIEHLGTFLEEVRNGGIG